VMPALNGIEATRQICEQLRTTKIIVLSGYATKEHVYQAVRAGASGYLLKDAAGVELINAIRTVHLGRSYLSQRILEAGYIDEGELQRFAQARRGPLESLSRREKEILQLVVEGRSSASIADMLGLSVKTVETYRSRLMHKLGVFDVASLVKFAIQHGVTSVE
jgi:DNA-binding NarL/FixJ family response regulator